MYLTFFWFMHCEEIKFGIYDRHHCSTDDESIDEYIKILEINMYC